MRNVRRLAGERVTLIGGAGFVGHHLALALIGEGARVEVVDALGAGHLVSLMSAPGDARNREFHLRVLSRRLELLRAAGVRLHAADARDPAVLASLLSGAQPGWVVHLAGVGGAAACTRDPHAAFEHGVRTLSATLHAARGRAHRLVHASSAAVYGETGPDRVSEDAPLRPTCAAGALHVAAEALLGEGVVGEDLETTIVRLGPVYGPGCVDASLPSCLIEAALAGDALVVPGDGLARLDWTFVDDVVAGLILALREPAAAGGTFNLCAGRARSSLDVAAIVREYFDGSHVEHGGPSVLATPAGSLSIERARRRLGFAPRHELETGIPKLVRWYLDVFAGDRAGTGSPASPRPAWSGPRPALGPSFS